MRKFPQPSKGKLFRFPLFFSVENYVFFNGQRPLFVMVKKGFISVVCFSSSVSAGVLPVPLVPTMPPIEINERKNLITPYDLYRVRGPIHAFCLGRRAGEFIYSLKSPEMVNSFKVVDANGKNQSYTALRVCSFLYNNNNLDFGHFHGDLAISGGWMDPLVLHCC